MSDKQKKLKVAAVIFDLDGTLIDSIDISICPGFHAVKSWRRQKVRILSGSSFCRKTS
jgi:hypothetical protein